MGIYSEERWLLCVLCSGQPSEAWNLGVHCIWTHSFDVHKFKIYTMRCWYKSKSTLQFFSLLLIDSFFLMFSFCSSLCTKAVKSLSDIQLAKTGVLQVVCLHCWSFPLLCRKFLKMCTHFIVVLFTVAKKKKKGISLLAQQWMDKELWFVCRMGFYSSVKKNQIMKHVRKQKDSEVIILSKVTQT
jgi:hypothetical protein